MMKSLLLLSTLILLSFTPVAKSGAQAQVAAAAPAPASMPPDTKNPVKATPESQAKAKKIYTYDCEMCHNANGDGKSDLAKDMGMTLTDLSDAKTLTGKTDAALFDLIRNGKDKMPPEDAARAKPDEVWNLIIYVRGLGK